MAQDRVEIVARLRKAADEIAQAGHNGWGNLMLAAADALDAARREVTEGMVEAACRAFKTYWSTVTNCYLSTADINLSAMRAALTAALGVEGKAEPWVLNAGQSRAFVADLEAGAADGKQSLPTEAGAADERETVETKWEPVLQDKSDTTERMRVPGGWLYRNIWLNDYSSASEGYRGQMVFVPIPTIAQGGER